MGPKKSSKVNIHGKLKENHVEKRKNAAGRVNSTYSSQDRDRSFGCTFCSKKFFSSSYLEVHLRTHTGERPFVCTVCKHRCSQKSNLKAHFARNHGIESQNTHGRQRKKNEKVSAVKIQFLNNSGIRKPGRPRKNDEKKTDQNAFRFQCDVCPRKFSCVSELQTHLKTHNQEKSYTCPVCKSGFSRAYGLKLHSFIHTGEKPFKCDKCDRAFREISRLNRHKQMFHTNKNSKTSVVNQKGSSISGTKIKIQKKSNTISASQSHQCDVCSKTFRTNWELRRHSQGTSHSLKKNLTRDSQGTSHSLKKNLTRDSQGTSHSLKKNRTRDSQGTSHSLKRNRTRDRQRRHICSVCKRGFLRGDHLKVHSFLHTGQWPFKCDVHKCNKGFVSKTKLQIHMQRPHASENCKARSPVRKVTRIQNRGDIKSHKCIFCSKEFRWKNVLDVHLRSHTGEKPFACPVCQSRFSRPDKLKLHVQNKHTGEKPFQCDKCKLRFSENFQLNSHKRKHHSGQNIRGPVKRRSQSRLNGTGTVRDKSGEPGPVLELEYGNGNAQSTSKSSCDSDIEKCHQDPVERARQWSSFLNLFNSKIVQH